MPLRPNLCLSLDFLSGTFGACRKFRILAVNDDCCRENLCLVPDTSISGATLQSRKASDILGPMVMTAGESILIMEHYG